MARKSTIIPVVLVVGAIIADPARSWCGSLVGKDLVVKSAISRPNLSPLLCGTVSIARRNGVGCVRRNPQEPPWLPTAIGTRLDLVLIAA